MAINLKALNKGVQIDNYNISLLLYADDIALISSSEHDMQDMLNQVDSWCRKWRLRINSQKSKIVHFRKNRSKRSSFNFHIGETFLEYVDSYKYLGVIFDEKRDFKKNAENLAKSGGRALGSVISKIHTNKFIGVLTYETVSLLSLTTAVEFGDTRNIIVLKWFNTEPYDTFSGLIGLPRY